MGPAASAVLDLPVRGGTIRVEVAGSGTPLVLLHGWTLDREVWRAQIDGLSANFRVVAVDRRGFGASSAPPDLAEEVEDLVALQRLLALGPMVLLGMSQAARVVLRFALLHPKRLLGIALHGAPLDGFVPEPRGEDAIPVARYAALVRDGKLDQMKALWRTHRLMHAPEHCTELLDALLDRYDGRDLVAPAVEPEPIAHELDAVSTPALVVTGEHDTPWRLLVGDALAYGLPNARRASVEGAYHLCNVSHPERYNRLLAGFVAALGG